MANRYSPSTINQAQNKKIFFDANILIYLFGYGTPTIANWEAQYATAYSALLKQNNTFVVDFIVISEFVNRAIKYEYESYLINNSVSKNSYRYKEYRDSLDGQKALDDIYLTVKDDILADFEVVKKSYSKDDLTLMCTADSLDFSDKAIIKICRENNFVLLTNDKDFSHSDIEILSCNRNIFNF